MGRLTEHIDYCFLACYERQGDKIREECPIYKCCYSRQMHEKLSHYEDLEEQGRLITTHEAAVVLAETFGYEHPCNFDGIDEWFPDVCHLAEMCPDGKTAIIACWEQYFKIKLKELKEGVE